jgi:hypothetical protein
VKAAVAAAVAKKDALVKAWADATANVPAMLGALRSRLEVLGASRKLPAGLDASALAGAKDGFAALEAAFAKATADFQAGNLAPAVEAAKGLVSKGHEIMRSLGMQVPN